MTHREIEQQYIIEHNSIPNTTLWDANFEKSIELKQIISGAFSFKLNDTGTAFVELPASYLAFIPEDIFSLKAFLVRNPTVVKGVAPYIVFQKNNIRWSGRLSKATLEKKDIETTVRLEFLDDIEDLKHVMLWANPNRTLQQQAPRTHTVFAPVNWGLKYYLMSAMRRIYNAFNWSEINPDFDIADSVATLLTDTGWFDILIPDFAIRAKPQNALTDTTPWTLMSARMNTWWEVAAPLMKRYNLRITTRRFLTGDETPFNGAKLKNGTLVVDIVPQGQKTVELDEVVDSRVKSFGLTVTPPQAENIYAGGKSAYGVNEMTRIIWDAVGQRIRRSSGAWREEKDTNITEERYQLGYNEQSINKLHQAMYSDVINAWQVRKTTQGNTGAFRYFESYVPGNNKNAYSLENETALAIEAKKQDTNYSTTLEIQDGHPAFIGDDFGVGDIVKANIILYDNKIYNRTQKPYIKQQTGEERAWDFNTSTDLGEGFSVYPTTADFSQTVTELSFGFDRGNREWTVALGDQRDQRTIIEQVGENIRYYTGILKEMGVLA